MLYYFAYVCVCMSQQKKWLNQCYKFKNPSLIEPSVKNQVFYTISVIFQMVLLFNHWVIRLDLGGNFLVCVCQCPPIVSVPGSGNLLPLPPHCRRLSCWGTSYSRDRRRWCTGEDPGCGNLCWRCKMFCWGSLFLGWEMESNHQNFIVLFEYFLLCFR